ncbi:MAG: single-stranded DNA-binding protein [Candidatus Muiribacteriota bacterium]
MNHVSLIGNLTKDPEMRTTNNGTSVTSFTVAVNTGWGDNKRTAFVPVKVWAKAAESCNQYLNKGSKVAVSGRIDTGSFEKDGKRIFTWEVTGHNVEFLDTKKSQNDNNNYNTDRQQSTEEPFAPHKDKNDLPQDDMNFDEDIPF